MVQATIENSEKVEIFEGGESELNTKKQGSHNGRLLELSSPWRATVQICNGQSSIRTQHMLTVVALVLIQDLPSFCCTDPWYVHFIWQ